MTVGISCDRIRLKKKTFAFEIGEGKKGLLLKTKKKSV
jgi:hypothetical protein